MNAHVYAFSLIADHLQGTCDYMGTRTQKWEVLPSRERDRGKLTEPSLILCVSVPHL